MRVRRNNRNRFTLDGDGDSVARGLDQAHTEAVFGDFSPWRIFSKDSRLKVPDYFGVSVLADVYLVNHYHCNGFFSVIVRRLPGFGQVYHFICL